MSQVFEITDMDLATAQETAKIYIDDGAAAAILPQENGKFTVRATYSGEVTDIALSSTSKSGNSNDSTITVLPKTSPNSKKNLPTSAPTIKWSELVAAARIAIIPAPRLRAVTLAQWIVESGRGSSDLALQHNNFGGLKWRDEMSGIATKVRYGAHDGFDDYCAFPSVETFIAGYWAFIQRDVYKGWRDHAEDPVGYINFLKARGYAADVNYVSKVLNRLPEAEALLQSGVSTAVVVNSTNGEDLDRPSRVELGDSLGPLGSIFGAPSFVTVGQVEHKFLGPRSNGLEGMIIHYDAGRDRPKGKADDIEWGAINCLESGQKNGFAYATISRSGKIYLPRNFSWENWGSHAGESLCPRTKRTGVSRYYVGFEVNCPGLVFPTDDADAYVPWFNAVMKKVKNKNGDWISVPDLDAKGRAKIRDANDATYKKSEVRYASQNNGNIRRGHYVPYTSEQYKALIAVALYLKRKFPDSFRFDYIFGHDDVSPDRKVDPGASLGKGMTAQGIEPAMTTEQFRQEVFAAWSKEPQS